MSSVGAASASKLASTKHQFQQLAQIKIHLNLVISSMVKAKGGSRVAFSLLVPY